MTQQEWERQVDSLFEVLDPKNGHSQKQSNKAVEEFIEKLDKSSAIESESGEHADNS